MSRRHPIDKAFQQKLENYASEAPPDLWQQIQQQRHRQQRLRSLAFYNRLQTAAILLLLFVLGAVMWQDRPANGALQHIATAAQSNSSPSKKSTPIVSTHTPTPINPEILPEQSALPTVPQTVADLQQLSKPIPSPIIENTSAPAVEAYYSEQLQEALTNTMLQPDAAQASSFQVVALPMVLRQVASTNRINSWQNGKCAAFGGKNDWRYYFDVMAAPSFAFRQLEPKGAEFQDYAKERNDTEEPLYGISAALRFSAVSDWGLVASTGINYSQINERFRFLSENEERITITNIYGTNGEIVGTDTLREVINREIVSNNRYRTLDIPLLLGYEIQGKKMNVAINGGAFVNLLFEPTGAFVSPDNNRPVSFSSDSPEGYPAFRNRLSATLYGSVGLAYKVSPRLQLLVEPHIKVYSRSLTRDEYMLDQKYVSTGLFVGLRHQFQL